VTEQPAHALANPVRRIVGIQQQNTAPHPAQNQSSRQTSWTATYDRDIERLTGLHPQQAWHLDLSSADNGAAGARARSQHLCRSGSVPTRTSEFSAAVVLSLLV
jgi:hypothetical protein